jgi:pyridoxamine 5'-phosphate oxidase
VTADLTVTSDPLALAATWLPATGSGSTPTMTLATIGLDGYPSARTVLLSAFDGARLHFHTDTRKAAEMAAVPRASVTIHWPDAARQLTVTGDVAPVTDREARIAYEARTHYLQVLAWVNDTHLAVASEADRRARWAAFEREHADSALTPPSTWGGYALTPLRMVFWSGATDGPSNRLAFERHAGGAWRGEVWPG